MNYKFKFEVKELKVKGYKLTKQRENILKIVCKNSCHMSVENIYENLKSKCVGLSTVYRNLSIFIKAGILKEMMM